MGASADDKPDLLPLAEVPIYAPAIGNGEDPMQVGSIKRIEFRYKAFVYDSESDEFRVADYDYNKGSSAAITTEIANSASFSLGDVARQSLIMLFGLNTYNVPEPDIYALLQVNFSSPFFLFQMVCVLLWLMDDYWYYSLVTAFMLVFLEIQMTMKR